MISKQKGKYTLFSYFIENSLIFYSSLNKTKKLVAFGIFEIQHIQDISKITELLNEFFTNSCLSYFAIQKRFQIQGDSQSLVVNFSNDSKTQILQDFQKVRDGINKLNMDYSIKENKILEHEFFSIINHNNEVLSPNSRVVRVKKKTFIKDKDLALYYSFYTLKLSSIDDYLNLIQFLRDRELIGNLILNISIDSKGQKIESLYFTEIRNNERNNIDLVKEVNEFFKSDQIISEIRPRNIEEFVWRNLWRLSISNDNSDKFNSFLNIEQKKLTIEDQIILTLKQELSRRKIEYQLLNENLFIIKKKFLFSIVSRLDLNWLTILIKKNIHKYVIYILLPDNREYTKLKNYSHMMDIKKLIILNLEAFNKFDYNFLN